MDFRAGGLEMALTISTHCQGTGAVGQDLGGCRGTRPPSAVTQDSIGNRPTGSQSTPLVCGCRESQDKRSMMPESMWQLESDENFICY